MRQLSYLISAFQLGLLVSFSALVAYGQQPAFSLPNPNEGEFILHDFHFKSGESLPQLRMHYYSFGQMVKDAQGRSTNAVLLLRGTGGSGRQFIAPQVSEVFFGPGWFLDINRYFVILPDILGHGKSSK